MTDTTGQADRGPAARAAAADANAKAATSKGSSIPATPVSSAASGKPDAETSERKDLNIGQSPNTNAEQESKEKFEEFGFDVQGQRKVTRLAGDSDTGKPGPVDIVQTGGGGAVDSKTGNPA